MKDPDRFEIGRELADAVRAEEAHVRRRAGASPLQGVAYAGRDQDLLRFVDSAVDARVGEFVSAFGEAGEAARGQLRDALTMEDNYTLISFARRSVVRALRSGDASPVRAGVAAVAAVDVERIDYRDAIWAVALLAWVARMLGSPDLVRDALGLPSEKMRPIFERFVAPSADDADLATWGYRVADLGEGLALVEAGYERFEPTVSLVDGAVAAAEVVEAGGYAVSSVRVGERPAVVWLPRAEKNDAGAVLDRVRGCVVISARPTRSGPEAEAQMLTAFLIEAADAGDAATLAGWASPADHAVLAAHHGSVVVVLVARSTVVGVDDAESDESLLRFGTAVGDVVTSLG